jgi:FtsH-binding integral membrane protein
VKALDIAQHALHALPLLGLMLGTFCRLRRTTCQTITPIRLSFWLLFGVSGVMLVLPVAHLLWPDWMAVAYAPSWWMVVFFWVVLAVQTSTARHWRHGVPHSYKKESAP